MPLIYKTNFNDLNPSGIINRETIVADKQLIANDEAYQVLTNQSGADLNIILPSSPAKGKVFSFVNYKTSTNNLLINGLVIEPNDIYETVFDGTEWIDL